MIEEDYFIGELKLAELWVRQTKQVKWCIGLADCVGCNLGFVIRLEQLGLARSNKNMLGWEVRFQV